MTKINQDHLVQPSSSLSSLLCSANCLPYSLCTLPQVYFTYCSQSGIFQAQLWYYTCLEPLPALGVKTTVFPWPGAPALSGPSCLPRLTLHHSTCAHIIRASCPVPPHLMLCLPTEPLHMPWPLEPTPLPFVWLTLIILLFSAQGHILRKVCPDHPSQPLLCCFLS